MNCREQGSNRCGAPCISLHLALDSTLIAGWQPTLLLRCRWLAAAGVNMGHGLNANRAGLARQGWRNTYWILCWVLAGLFGLYSLAAGVDTCRALCCGRKRKAQHQHPTGAATV